MMIMIDSVIGSMDRSIETRLLSDWGSLFFGGVSIDVLRVVCSVSCEFDLPRFLRRKRNERERKEITAISCHARGCCVSTPTCTQTLMTRFYFLFCSLLCRSGMWCMPFWRVTKQPSPPDCRRVIRSSRCGANSKETRKHRALITFVAAYILL